MSCLFFRHCKKHYCYNLYSYNCHIRCFRMFRSMNIYYGNQMALFFPTSHMDKNQDKMDNSQYPNRICTSFSWRSMNSRDIHNHNHNRKVDTFGRSNHNQNICLCKNCKLCNPWYQEFDPMPHYLLNN